VLDGERTFDLEGEQRILGAGAFVRVPPGVAHTFANRGSAPARVLNILQPAGLEQYLKEAFKRMADGSPWTPAEMAEIADGYDFEALPEHGSGPAANPASPSRGKPRFAIPRGGRATGREGPSRSNGERHPTPLSNAKTVFQNRDGVA
jgi:hypothetical protein